MRNRFRRNTKYNLTATEVYLALKNISSFRDITLSDIQNVSYKSEITVNKSFATIEEAKRYVSKVSYFLNLNVQFLSCNLSSGDGTMGITIHNNNRDDYNGVKCWEDFKSTDKIYVAVEQPAYKIRNAIDELLQQGKVKCGNKDTVATNFQGNYWNNYYFIEGVSYEDLIKKSKNGLSSFRGYAPKVA